MICRVNINQRIKGNYMTTAVIVGLVALVGGFVFGVLFERRNSKKVEAALKVAEAALAKAGVKV